MPRRVLLKDIAAAASVSTAVVSFVLNGQAEKRRVGAATAEKVRAVARQLGYVPNLAAKRLRYAGDRQEPLTIAILTSLESSLSLAGPLLQGVRRVVMEKGEQERPIQLNVETFHHRHLDELAHFADGSRYNAAILSNTMPEDDVFLADFQPRVPVVLFNRIVPGYHAVIGNEELVGRQAAKRCLAAGKAIAVLRPRDMTQAVQRRVEAFHLALKAAGAESRTIMVGGLQAFAARNALHNALGQGASFDIIFAVTGILAEGAQAALSIAGLDDRVQLIETDEERAALYDIKRNMAQHHGVVMGEAATRCILRAFEPDPPPPELIHFTRDRERRRVANPRAGE